MGEERRTPLSTNMQMAQTVIWPGDRDVDGGSEGRLWLSFERCLITKIKTDELGLRGIRRRREGLMTNAFGVKKKTTKCSLSFWLVEWAAAAIVCVTNVIWIRPR